MHSIVLYIVVLIIVAYLVAYLVVYTYVPTCGHRALGGLYRAPIDVHCRATLWAVAVVGVLLPSYKNAKNLGQSA